MNGVISKVARWTGAVLTCTAVLSACEDQTATEPPGVTPVEGAIAMVVVSGNEQRAKAGTELPEPLVVRVTNSAGVAVANQVVNWRVLEGGGSLFGGVSVTDRDGYARERWTLGTGVGEAQRVEARAIDASNGDKLIFGTFSAQALAEDPPPPGSGGTAPGAPGSPTITTRAFSADSFAVTAVWRKASGAVNYAWQTGVNTGGWSRNGTVTDSTVTLRVPTNTTGPYFLCVRGVNAAGTQGSPACNSYAAPSGNVGGGTTVATVAVTPSSASVQVGQTVNLSAAARDAAGDAVTGRSVTWASSNTAIATVSTSGAVTGVAAGSATITATVDGIRGSATVTVTTTTTNPPPSGGAGVLFRSDWSFGTGNTEQILRDGGKWASIVCWPNYGQVLSVVPGSQAGWTATQNVMQVTNRGAQYCGQVETRNEIAQGQDMYIRMYIRVEDENQMNFHPVDLNCCGDIQAPLWAIYSPRERVDYDYKFSLATSSIRDWKPREKLRQGVWYRFEWFVEYTNRTTGTARIWPRVYDMAGNLLYDANSFIPMNGGSQTLQQYYNAGNTSRFTNLDLARRFAVGYEGNAMARDTGRKWYYAAVEIRSDTWPGPVR